MPADRSQHARPRPGQRTDQSRAAAQVGDVELRRRRRQCGAQGLRDELRRAVLEHGEMSVEIGGELVEHLHDVGIARALRRFAQARGQVMLDICVAGLALQPVAVERDGLFVRAGRRQRAAVGLAPARLGRQQQFGLHRGLEGLLRALLAPQRQRQVMPGLACLGRQRDRATARRLAARPLLAAALQARDVGQRLGALDQRQAAPKCLLGFCRPARSRQHVAQVVPDLRLARRDQRRALEQVERPVVRAPLVLQHAHEVERVGAPRLALQQLGVDLLGAVQVALPVARDRVLQGLVGRHRGG
jgi:hypothetical protein